MGNLSVEDAPGKKAPELSHNYLESPHLLASLVLPFLAITLEKPTTSVSGLCLCRILGSNPNFPLTSSCES